jgi:cytochrome d ubiquinol oxidase subunit II
MEILWYCIVALMLAMYVILDGFDLGVGIIHRLIGKTEEERRLLIKTIGPVWDGNEVWLLAAGGTMYFAFPKLYASGFSGFYLPLMIVLWLLILRAVGIEFRHQLQSPIWKSLFDTIFSIASILLAIVFGAALGNVIRGVPLNPEGYFFAPLWTTFTVVPEAGILDWFTVILGIVALSTLTAHGGYYVAMKTEGEIQKRSRAIAQFSWWIILITSILGVIATTSIRPDLWKNYADYKWGNILPILGAVGFTGMYYFSAKRKDTPAFISSAIFIGSMLGATAFASFPYFLHSSINPNDSLTVYNTITKEYGLNVGLVWWIIGILLATAYFIYLYRSFRGKVRITSGDIGY